MNETQPTPINIVPPSEEYSAIVLLVDDQIIICEAVRRALANQSGIEFHYCTNPAEAIQIAETMKPTVILQDLIMPGVDGLALVRQYRTNLLTKDIPIIVLSSKEDPLVKSEAFGLGVNDYLVKLPDAIELVARIRYHTKAYVNQLQRDEAYRALRVSQQQLMEMNIELQRLTSLDGLTGLSNRRKFDEYFEVEWRRARREQTPLCVILIDVDNFKLYNDTYGHLGGDDALIKVAKTIQKSLLRPADLAARFGGEEFATILPGTSLAGGMHVGERMRQAIIELQIPHSATSSGAHLTVSIGGASTVPKLDRVALSLIEAADVALYEAKKAGKNRVVVSEPIG